MNELENNSSLTRMSAEFTIKEDILIKKALEKCDDVAFVLREKEADILAKHIQSKLQTNRTAIFVGKDFLSVSQIGFYMHGLLPHYLLRKLKYSFKECGIWNWMVKLGRKNNFISNRLG